MTIFSLVRFGTTEAEAQNSAEEEEAAKMGVTKIPLGHCRDLRSTKHVSEFLGSILENKKVFLFVEGRGTGEQRQFYKR